MNAPASFKAQGSCTLVASLHQEAYLGGVPEEKLGFVGELLERAYRSGQANGRTEVRADVHSHDATEVRDRGAA